MNTNSNLTGLIVLSAISSTALSLDYKISDFTLMPTEGIEFVADNGQSWSYDSINNGSYTTKSETDKINIIYEFSKELILNSESLDSEFSQIVDDNFFDLL